MQPVLLALSNLPPWVVFAIMGGVFGAVGALLGAGLSRLGYPKFARLIAIVAIVVSFQVSRIVLMPSVALAKLNEGLPKPVDEYTVLQSAEYTPQGLAYRYQLFGGLPGDFQVSQIKDGAIGDLCSNWAADFAARRVSKIDYHYTWAAGGGSFSVTPQDCRQ